MRRDPQLGASVGSTLDGLCRLYLASLHGIALYTRMAWAPLRSSAHADGENAEAPSVLSEGRRLGREFRSAVAVGMLRGVQKLALG